MRLLTRIARVVFLLGALTLATVFAARFGPGGLWRGFDPALATTGQPTRAPYDLTRLEAVNETLKTIRKKYVDPDRVKPKQMLLSALNYVQRDVAQVLVHQDTPDEVVVRVGAESRSFRVDNVQGPWDVAARLREIFGFLQKNLRGEDVDLRALEYAACNGMLHTLDPHSVFLSPEAFREMNVQTSGAFGGLGIVISVRDQMLTVMRPMPGTPAQRAGLKRLDRIVKIENESTLNMPLDDAVRRLRGEPGSTVTVWITRDGEDGFATPKPVQLKREVIKVASVASRMLEGGVGYLQLKNFQATTLDEVQRALEAFRSRGPLEGVVLDLRGNPGGLLDQAVKVADAFLESGVIVATQGSSEGREERAARGPGTEPPYPIVVLIDGSSASASEILAGALKNHRRALVVGQQSFGKGSVQLVFPDVTPEKAALKLTIAQYLTPGDVSIQGVGITPDIELDPMTVDALEMDLTVQQDGLREKELFASLASERAAPPGRPEEVVRYQFTSADRERLRELGSDADDEPREDFPVRFARELVLAVPDEVPSLEQLDKARPLIERVRREELAKVSAELEKLGIDWALPAQGGATARAGDLVVTARTSRPNDEVVAGQPMDLEVRVKNTGSAPVYRLRAQTESANGYFDSKELVFGRIAPGEEKSASVPLGWCEVEGRKVGSTAPTPKDAKRTCKIPMDAVERSDGIVVRFEAEGGEAPAKVEVRPTVRALPRPLFKYSYHVVDDRSGNGDGRVQRGEKVSMYLEVKNVGAGPSYESQANLSNLSGDGLLLHEGRFDISHMKPGEERRVTFSFDVSPSLAEPEAVVALSVGDRELREFATEKVKIPIEAPLSLGETASVRAAGPQGAVLREGPKEGARPIGRLRPGTTVSVTARAAGFDKVRVEGSRFAWVPTSELVDGSGSPAHPLRFDPLYVHTPPDLEIGVTELATRAKSVRLRGKASSNDRLVDLYGFVGARKFFYQSNRDAKDPSRAELDVEVPLKPGVNIIHVVARQSADSTTRRMLVVRRDAEDGSLLEAPKSDDDYVPWETPTIPE
jgi:carboxyl-terminal processing protease